MSAIPQAGPTGTAIAAPRALPGMRVLRATGRTLLMLGLAVLVPGEAARIGADLTGD